MSDLLITLRLAWRSRLAGIGFALLLCLATLVALAAQFSARQPATVALDVGISVIRFALPLLGIILAQELIAHEFERRYCLTSFGYPRPRHSWLLGRVAAILVIMATLLLLMAGLLHSLVAYVGSAYVQSTPVSMALPYAVVLSFILVDIFVVTAFATLLAVTAVTPVFVLVGSLGFLLVARSYASIIELLRHDTSLVAKFAEPERYIGGLTLLKFVIPDLGGLDVRMVALYGKMEFLPPDWPFRILGALAYAVATLTVAAWALRKRDFG